MVSFALSEQSPAGLPWPRSWGLLGGGTHSLLPLFYPAFLTILLVHRASRDQVRLSCGSEL